MAAKSKKRLSNIENKLIKLDNLELHDVICPICQSILINPVTLPCFHSFCVDCFHGSVENNALCCPLCRLRIGSWLRTATKQKNLVNEELWKFIETKFSNEIYSKIKGEDVDLPEEKPVRRLSAPGEIRREYESELKRLREERLQLEEKHIEETELLIKKIQEEEEEAHRKYLEALKQDEILAEQIQNELVKCAAPPTKSPMVLRHTSTRPRLKDTKIDGYMSKIKTTVAPTTTAAEKHHTDDHTLNAECSTPAAPLTRLGNAGSPEMVPSYSKLIKSIIDKKNKLVPGFWNKENGESTKEKKEDSKLSSKKSIDTLKDIKSKVKHKSDIPSLLVSLPLPQAGILKQKANLLDKRKRAGRADSMRQELCHFKPIDKVTPNRSATKGPPLRVPAVRAIPRPASPVFDPPPTRAQYLENLCNLREKSLAKKLSSAFVIAMDLLRVHKKESPIECDPKVSSNAKKGTSTSCVVPPVPCRRNPVRNKQIVPTNCITGINKPNSKTNLRRTRSMGSISKDENERTPKKTIKQRKAVSDKKPCSRSDFKKSTKKLIEGSPLYSETFNNKVNLAVKNLSSPFKNCDVKHIILHEQMSIESILEQEKDDFELARKIEEEWNRRQPRRAAMKRQIMLSYGHRPAKKLKV